MPRAKGGRGAGGCERGIAREENNLGRNLGNASENRAQRHRAMRVLGTKGFIREEDFTKDSVERKKDNWEERFTQSIRDLEDRTDYRTIDCARTWEWMRKTTSKWKQKR